MASAPPGQGGLKMFDIDEIRKQAQQAKEQALASMKETMEKNEERISKIEVPSSEKSASVSAAEVEEQIVANTQRQVEILGQMFGSDSMAQMAVNEELLQKMVNDKVAEATSATAGDLMGQLFGEDMGILAAALETLEMEDADDEEELSFDLEMEENLYATLEETMARLEAMPEPEAIPYQKDDVKWERFGILLSGILSTLNSHNLDGMDVSGVTVRDVNTPIMVVGLPEAPITGIVMRDVYIQNAKQRCVFEDCKDLVLDDVYVDGKEIK